MRHFSIKFNFLEFSVFELQSFELKHLLQLGNASQNCNEVRYKIEPRFNQNFMYTSWYLKGAGKVFRFSLLYQK